MHYTFTGIGIPFSLGSIYIHVLIAVNEDTQTEQIFNL